MSRSLFDDLDSSPSGALDSADARTLRLSAPSLTPEGLEALVRYQEAFLGHLEGPSGGVDAIATAHERGVSASGLETKAVELGMSLLRAYCGQRWTAHRLRERLGELEKHTDAASVDKARRAREELRRLEDLEPLARRYGQQAVELLDAHEDRLVALHTRLQRALTRT